MVESQPAYSEARLLVVMGSTGCGKSTVGAALSKQLGATFIEGDDHHSPENKAKMQSGTPLNDEDRWPWLQQIGVLMRTENGTVVTSCSSLRQAYRQHITVHAEEPVLFVYLHGSEALLASRLSSRHGHFMNKDLLKSQLDLLEKPDSSEFSLTISVDQDPHKIVDQIVALLSK